MSGALTQKNSEIINVCGFKLLSVRYTAQKTSTLFDEQNQPCCLMVGWAHRVQKMVHSCAWAFPMGRHQSKRILLFEGDREDFSFVFRQTLASPLPSGVPVHNPPWSPAVQECFLFLEAQYKNYHKPCGLQTSRNMFFMVLKAGEFRSKLPADPVAGASWLLWGQL